MCVEADNFIARTSGLTGPHITAYNNLICGLVTDGVWSKFDAFYVLWAQDTTTALLNLVSSSYPLTAVGSPAFAAGAGYTGVDGPSAVYLDTGFNPSTAGGQFALNNGHISAWSLTNVVSTSSAGALVGGRSDPNAEESEIFSRYSDDKAYFRLNSVNNSGTSNTDGRGFYVSSRTGSSTLTGYLNASSIFIDSAAVGGLTNINLFITATNLTGAAYGCGAQIAMVSIGAGLTATDVTNFYNRFLSYQTDYVATVEALLGQVVM